MAELQPLFQDVNGVYHGYHLGLPYRDLISEGVVGAGDLKVTESAPQAMSVKVAAGVVWVLGDANPDEQPCYRCRLDATKNVIVPAADATHDRIDLIVAQLNDGTFDVSGAWSWAVELVEGVAAAAPVAPAAPASAVVLAQVRVPAASGTVVNANITDERPLAQVGGAVSAAPSAMPGEVRIWPSATLPDSSKYGTWVWADGTSYLDADYVDAFGNIDAAWDTHHGKAAPAAGYRRVPDMRGAVPIGMDTMPGGAAGAAGRATRASAIAAAFGEEYHLLATPEMPSHVHGVTDPQHAHPFYGDGTNSGSGSTRAAWIPLTDGGDERPTIEGGVLSAATNISIQATGGGGAHENVPPANAVPFIVFLG